MEQKQRYRVLNDVRSYKRPYPVYLKAGAEVTILHDHMDMMIVQDSSGLISHSRTDNLMKIEESAVPAIASASMKGEEKQATSRKKKAPPLINQPDLFT